MIKTTFSIKDLENLSGIKAHTIRIWEKRYDLLVPERSESNIRCYDTSSLQKILNVSYLNNNGFKISAIAALDDKGIERQVNELVLKENNSNHSVQRIKMAMVNFDKHLFDEVYNNGLQKFGFRGVFREILIPFLNELGFLWLTNTVNVAHEHFITHLIKQKLLAHLESVEYKTNQQSNELYVMFLPPNEMHDLGLLFLNYELLSRGCKTVYLGASMTLDHLHYFKGITEKPIFITYITVYPSLKKIPKFLKQFENKVSKGDNNELWILGQMVTKIQELPELKENHKTFKTLIEAIEKLDKSVDDKILHEQ